MKKTEIANIRESITKIVSMLTHQRIKVTQRGTNAYVKYDPKTGAVKEVNIPYIPDDASEEFVAAVQGFLDHEVGHVLYSDPKALAEAAKLGKRVMNMANILEDVFVERKMTEGFRGAGHNLESVRNFYLQRIAKVKIDEALAEGNVEAARGYATVAAFRAWGGQHAAIDFINQPVIADLVKPVREKVGEELIAQIAGCNNSMECLALASKVVKKLETPKPPAPPMPEPTPERGESKDADDGESSEDFDEEAGEDSESGEGGEVTKSVEADEDHGREEKEKVDGEVEDGDGDAGEEDGDDAEPDDAKDGETEESGDKSSDPTADTPDSDADSSAESDTGDAEGGSESEEGEAPGEEDGVATDERSDEASDTESASEIPEYDNLADLLDEDRDFDKDISKELADLAAKEVSESDYAVFSTDWDKTEPAPKALRSGSVEKMEHAVKDQLGVMQKMLERAISANERKGWNAGQRRGRISPGGLFRTAVGDDRVFRQRYETKAKNTAVSIVVDCSGSMGCGRIELAGVTAYALSSVLDRLKITHEVIGFTTYNSGEFGSLMAEDARSVGKRDIYDMGWARIEPLYMPVFKGFNERLGPDSLSRIAHLTEDPNWLNQNVDGESVQIAARRLMTQRAERRVMIVLSDGEPCCIDGKGLRPHLKNTVKELSGSMEVIGIGIQTSSVKNYYPKNVVLNDVETLPTTAMAELTKVLLAA